MQIGQLSAQRSTKKFIPIRSQAIFMQMKATKELQADLIIV